MVIEQKNNEFIIKISSSTSTKRMQQMLDFLRYTEIAGKSKATEQDLASLLKIVKKARTKKVKVS